MQQPCNQAQDYWQLVVIVSFESIFVHIPLSQVKPRGMHLATCQQLKGWNRKDVEELSSLSLFNLCCLLPRLRTMMWNQSCWTLTIAQDIILYRVAKAGVSSQLADDTIQ